MGTNSTINRLRKLIVGALLTCTGTVAGEEHTYLRVVGPAPLRFSAPSPEYDPAKVLPPLKMSDAPATNVVETVTKKPEVPVTERPVEPEVIVQEPVVPVQPATNVAVENTPVAPAVPPEANQMTPQMLLRYFNRDGTREVLVPAGVEFMPPPPAGGSGRSSAVYSSPPAK